MVTVRDIQTGADFAADVSGVDGAGVSVDGVGFTFTLSASNFRVEVTDPTASPQDASKLPSGESIAYFRADAIGLETGRMDSATFTVSVGPDALPADASPSEVTHFRYHDGEWQQLETTTQGDGKFTARMPGFSAFAVGVPAATGSEDDVGTTKTGSP